jgi:glycosyltransferase involved in cell wall biosynthesis
LSYPRIHAEVRKLIGEQPFDLVHVDHLFLCKHLGFVKKDFGLPLVLTTHNVESSLAEQTLKELGVNRWLRERALNRIRETEKESVSLADHVVCVSQNDFDEIAVWGLDRDRLSVIPLGIYFPADAPLPKETGKVIFVGSSFEPNRFALERILRDIAPKVPEVRFEIIGSVCEGVSNLEVPENVKLDGRVSQEELYRIYGEAAVAIAPLSVGSGLKMKVLEYLSWGRPTVATPIAVQGLIGLQDNTDLLVEEQIEDFPLRIKELLNNDELRLRLYKNSREKTRKYSFENIVVSYENLLRTIAKRGKETAPRA